MRQTRPATKDGEVMLARLLRELLRDPRQAEAGYRKIHAVEHQADRVCQETIEMLHSSFITPIDRSDIHLLSSRIGIRTLGMRLVKLTPMHGFAAETAASAVLIGTSPPPP
jgi:hypothetical protein